MAADDVKIREKFCWSEEEAKKKKKEKRIENRTS